MVTTVLFSFIWNLKRVVIWSVIYNFEFGILIFSETELSWDIITPYLLRYATVSTEIRASL